MRYSIHAVITTLLEAIALVVLVVIVFLQTWRAADSLAGLPVSFIGTFALLLGFGYTINALSLFGMAAIGIVVDDAIVVVENVDRNIADGLSPRDATYKAMQEVSGPIIDRPDTGCRIRTPGIHVWPGRPVLPAVRDDHCDLDSDLGVQLADLVAGAVGDPAQRAWRAERPSDPGHGRAVRGVLNAFNRVFIVARNTMAVACAAWSIASW